MYERAIFHYPGHSAPLHVPIPAVAAATWSVPTTFVSLSGTPVIVATALAGVVAGSAARSGTSHASGKFYVEITVTNYTAGLLGVGVIGSTFTMGTVYVGGNADSLGAYRDGNILSGGGFVGAIGAVFTSGDIFGMAVDLDNRTIWFRKNNGIWNNSGLADPATNTGGLTIAGLSSTVYVACDFEVSSDGSIQTANFFGASTGTFGEPSGFGDWS